MHGGAPFLELGASSVAKLLESDELMVESETEVLSALRAWFEHDAVGRQGALEELLPSCTVTLTVTLFRSQRENANTWTWRT